MPINIKYIMYFIKYSVFLFFFFNFINNKNYSSNYCNQYVAMNYYCSKYSHSNLNENSLIKSRDSHDSYKYKLQSLSSSFAKFLIVIIISPSCVKIRYRHLIFIKTFHPLLQELFFSLVLRYKHSLR